MCRFGGSQTVSDYSIYVLFNEERVFSDCRTIINCADDEEAIRVAEQWVDLHDVELWQSNRFITRFIPRREHIDFSASRFTTGAPEVGSRPCPRQVGRSGALRQCLAPRIQRPELARKVEWGLALPLRPPQGYQMPVGPYARRCAARAEAQRRLAQARY